MKDFNILIAEFMGLTEPFELPQHGTIRPNGDFKTEFTVEQLKYHSSWDWLMPIVEKIEQVNEGVPKELINLSLFSYREEVYKAVVEFIKWYNENKQ